MNSIIEIAIIYTQSTRISHTTKDPVDGVQKTGEQIFSQFRLTLKPNQSNEHLSSK